MQKMPSGLSNEEAQKLFAKYGPNEIIQERSYRIVKAFVAQFTSPLMLILIGAAAVSLLLSYIPPRSSDVVDGILILIIVFLSGITGFIQDYKAENTVNALKKLAAPKVTVIREAQEREISITELVPGDIVVLSAGGIISADMTLIEARHLSCDESMLTGESKAITKRVNDALFKGTSIQMGGGLGKVTATGMRTRLGSIAGALQQIKEKQTRFQKELAQLGRGVLVGILIIIAIIFFIGIVKFTLLQSFMLSVSLAVAAIPEGLPAVLTVVLAMSAHAMMKKKSLVRRLSAVESMGDIDVICTDKTGTLTRNEMNVVAISQDQRVFSAKQSPGDFDSGAQALIVCGFLCNDIRVVRSEGGATYHGDQTQMALYKFGESRFTDGMRDRYARIDEKPFTSERKLMSVLDRDDRSGRYYVFSKGAPEILLKLCQHHMRRDGTIEELNEEMRMAILKQYDIFGRKAFRVLGAALKELPSDASPGIEENGLTWLGLFAMTDPPREEVKKAIADSMRAGIRIIMLTGDYAETAKAVAGEIGLCSAGVITGVELDAMNDESLRAIVFDRGFNIFARISPFHKLRILRMLQTKYTNVAMTGDGVNDALALKQADVGISMGMRGTETAKQASDIILLDDNFATIRDAIEEGRRAVDNVKKFINYLAVSNFAEIGVLFFATMFLTIKEPILLPVHILWINLVTDGMPALALGVDPARPGVMDRPPRRGAPLVDRTLRWLIGAIGFKKILVLFATYLIIRPLGFSVARTALFTGFILYEFVRIGTIRQQEKLGFFANKLLVAAVFGSVMLHLVILYSPLNRYFNVVPLGIYPWMVLLAGVTLGYVAAIFITKAITKRIHDS